MDETLNVEQSAFGVAGKGGRGRLHESEEQLQAILDTLMQGVLLLDNAGNVQWMNPAAMRLHGFDGREQLNRHLGRFLELFEMHYPDGREMPTEVWPAMRALKGETVVDFEIHVRRCDSRKEWIGSYNAVPIRDSGGQITRVLITIDDITARKRAERREEWRNRILDALSTGIPLGEILELVTRSVEADEADSLCSVLLLDEEGKHVLHGAAPRLPDDYNRAIDGSEIGEATGSCGTAAYRGERVIVEDILTHPYWVRYRELAQRAGLRSCWSEPIFSSTGQVLGTFAIYHRDPRSPSREQLQLIDYTARLTGLAIERKREEERLREADRRFRVLLDNVRLMAIGLDREGRVTYANPFFLELTGFSLEAVLGKPWLEDFIPERYRSKVRRVFNEIIEHGRHFHFENPILTKNGEERLVAWSNTALKDRTGKVEGTTSLGEDITERRRSEDAIRESENRHRARTGELETLMEALPAPVLIAHDRGCRTITGNRACYEVLGLEHGQNPSKTAPEGQQPNYEVRIDGKIVPGDQLPIQRAAATGKPVQNEELEILRGDGSVRWLYGGAVPLFNENGTVRGCVSAFVDITERKNAERALRQREGQLKEAQRVAQMGSWEWMVSADIVTWSDELYRIFGRDAKFPPPRYRDLSELFTAESWARLDAAVQQALKTGAGYEVTLEYVRTDGKRGWIVSRGEAVRGASGAVEKLWGTGWDVTERTLADEALHSSQERLLLAQEAARIGTFEWDVRTDANIWSKELEALYGLGSGEFDRTHSDWLKRIHPADVQAVRDGIAEALKTGEFFKDFRVVWPDGSIHWLQARARVYYDDCGEPVRAVGVNVDITELKRVEESLKQAKEVAETANRAKDQFLAVLSHELRTPLTPVLASVTAMEAQENLPAEMRADMEMIHRNVEMESQLIDDLLDVTRISRGKIELEYEAVDIHACLESALEICQGEIEGNHLEVLLDLNAAQHHVWADPVRLRQVFWNLFRNSAKFTPAGGTIRVRSTNSNGRVKVEVADTGVGIEPEALPRIFNAFEQGEKSRTRHFGGLGLGLSIAKAVVEMHHGHISVFSEGQGKGATFVVELTPVDEGAMLKKIPEVPGSGTGNTREILLVEDHADTLRILSRLLRGWGYKVTPANSVHSALELASAQKFDVLVSDLGLPDGTGGDIMRQVKDQHGLHGIALSGYGTEDDIRESHTAGFEQHLIKPISAEVLRAALQRIDQNAA